ncbi:MAG: hypothetical protein JXB47_19715, partial [Anaerolineae bacterium]|nr:hypothetical protein [Anaerolineae bacterium]
GQRLAAAFRRRNYEKRIPIPQTTKSGRTRKFGHCEEVSHEPAREANRAGPDHRNFEWHGVFSCMADK